MIDFDNVFLCWGSDAVRLGRLEQVVRHSEKTLNSPPEIKMEDEGKKRLIRQGSRL
jgi:hypothetical protein